MHGFPKLDHKETKLLGNIGSIEWWWKGNIEVACKQCRGTLWQVWSQIILISVINMYHIILAACIPYSYKRIVTSYIYVIPVIVNTVTSRDISQGDNIILKNSLIPWSSRNLATYDLNAYTIVWEKFGMKKFLSNARYDEN